MSAYFTGYRGFAVYSARFAFGVNLQGWNVRPRYTAERTTADHTTYRKWEALGACIWLER